MGHESVCVGPLALHHSPQVAREFEIERKFYLHCLCRRAVLEAIPL